MAGTIFGTRDSMMKSDKCRTLSSLFLRIVTHSFSYSKHICKASTMFQALFSQLEYITENKSCILVESIIQ